MSLLPGLLKNLTYEEIQQLLLWTAKDGGQGPLPPSDELGAPSQLDNPAVLGIVGVYGILFLIGLPGNAAIASLIIRLLLKTRSLPYYKTLDPGFVHILALSLDQQLKWEPRLILVPSSCLLDKRGMLESGDLLVILCLPMAMTDLIREECWSLVDLLVILCLPMAMTDLIREECWSLVDLLVILCLPMAMTDLIREECWSLVDLLVILCLPMAMTDLIGEECWSLVDLLVILCLPMAMTDLIREECWSLVDLLVILCLPMAMTDLIGEECWSLVDLLVILCLPMAMTDLIREECWSLVDLLVILCLPMAMTDLIREECWSLVDLLVILCLPMAMTDLIREECWSLVDLLVILCLPMAMTDMLFGHWMFGGAACKAYWLLESMGKIMSTFILTLMSFDRYITICCTPRRTQRSKKTVLIVLGVLATLALAALAPLPYYTHFFHYEYIAINAHSPEGEQNESGSSSWHKVVVSKCQLSEGFVHLRAYTLLLFVFGFCIPLLLITAFYTGILRRLKLHRSGSSVVSRVPVGRVTLHSLAIVVFYTLCWAPYWTGVLYSHFRQTPSRSHYREELSRTGSRRRKEETDTMLKAYEPHRHSLDISPPDSFASFHPSPL